MASIDAHQIQGFPADDRIWRIDYFGHVSRPSGALSTHVIEVGLSPLLDGHRSPLLARNVMEDQQRVVRVEVGLLPSLAIGSAWRNGKPIAVAAPRVSRLQIDTTSAQLVRITRKIPDPFGRLAPPLSPFDHKLGARLFPRVADGFLVAVKDPETNDPFGILIPPIELIRFYFCFGSSLSREVFNGNWDEQIWEEGCSWDAATKTCTLGVRYLIPFEDAFLLARYRESKEMARQVYGVHQALQRAADQKSPVAFTTKFPFSGETRLKAVCVPLRYRDPRSDEGRTRRFVAQILTCSYPFPFAACKLNPRFLHPGQGANHNDPDLLPMHISTRRKDRDALTKEPPKPDPPFPSTPEEPSTLDPILPIQSCQDRFEDLVGKKVSLTEKDEQSHRYEPHPEEADQPSGLSTGSGTRGDSETTRAGLVIIKTAPISPNLEMFCHALKVLKKTLHKPWRLDGMTPGHPGSSFEKHEIAVTALPVRADELIGRRSRWVYKEKGVPRRAVVACLTNGVAFAYLIDFERTTTRKRPAGEISTGKKSNDEKYSAIIVVNLDRRSIPEEALLALLRGLVDHRGRPIGKMAPLSPASSLDMKPINHYNASDTAAFAARLKKRAETMLNLTIGQGSDATLP